MAEAAALLGEAWGMEGDKTYVPFDEVEGLKLPNLNYSEEDLEFPGAGPEEQDLDPYDFDL